MTRELIGWAAPNRHVEPGQNPGQYRQCIAKPVLAQLIHPGKRPRLRVSAWLYKVHQESLPPTQGTRNLTKISQPVLCISNGEFITGIPEFRNLPRDAGRGLSANELRVGYVHGRFFTAAVNPYWLNLGCRRLTSVASHLRKKKVNSPPAWHVRESHGGGWSDAASQAKENRRRRTRPTPAYNIGGIRARLESAEVKPASPGLTHLELRGAANGGRRGRGRGLSSRRWKELDVRGIPRLTSCLLGPMYFPSSRVHPPTRSTAIATWMYVDADTREDEEDARSKRFGVGGERVAHDEYTTGRRVDLCNEGFNQGWDAGERLWALEARVPRWCEGMGGFGARKEIGWVLGKLNRGKITSERHEGKLFAVSDGRRANLNIRQNLADEKTTHRVGRNNEKNPRRLG
ncbi:hypothetical protein C8R46DRAFT_1028274 [Mycena filopes]|nr:hypothetical protein C8R46DRAFT_1028274 [Mycena filopes]